MERVPLLVLFISANLNIISLGRCTEVACSVIYFIAINKTEIYKITIKDTNLNYQYRKVSILIMKERELSYELRKFV